MKMRLVNGFEYPADPPARPRAMSDEYALKLAAANLQAARGLVGFHERGLYLALCRAESLIRSRLASVLEAGGSRAMPDGTQKSLLSES